LTKTSTSNENINKAVNLFERWEIEEREWNTEVGTKDMNVFNMDTNRSKTVQVQGFKRLKPISQITWEKFYSSIVEPTTGEFYPEKNIRGQPIEPSDGGPRARVIISQIIRLKSVTGEEYLYTLGNIYGFNSLGVLVSYPYSKKEVFTKTFFKKNRMFDSKSGHMVEKVESPNGQQDHYLLEFSPSAVDELFSHTIKNDTPFVYRRNKHTTPTNPCSFIVKEEASGIAVQVQWSDIKITLDLFKNKSFYYLFRSEYISPQVKAAMKEMNEGLTGEKTPTNPTTVSGNTFTPNSSKEYQAYK
jgi:hypothetical protein